MHCKTALESQFLKLDISGQLKIALIFQSLFIVCIPFYFSCCSLIFIFSPVVDLLIYCPLCPFHNCAPNLKVPFNLTAAVLHLLQPWKKKISSLHTPQSNIANSFICHKVAVTQKKTVFLFNWTTL